MTSMENPECGKGKTPQSLGSLRRGPPPSLSRALFLGLSLLVLFLKARILAPPFRATVKEQIREYF